MVYKKGVKRPSNIKQTPENTGCHVLEPIYLRIKISRKTQRFDVPMTSFSSEKRKFKLT